MAAWYTHLYSALVLRQCQYIIMKLLRYWKKINATVSYARNKIIALVSEIYVQMTPNDLIMNAKRV